MALLFLSVFYRKERRVTRETIENLQKEIKGYQNMIAQIQGQLQQAQGLDPAPEGHVQGASAKKEKRIWVKIRSFD